jgi:hypothetical protein
MRPRELYTAWRAQAADPTGLVHTVRESFLSAGSNAGAQIRALELLLISLPTERTVAILESISKDARALRRSGGGEPAENVRAKTLRQRQDELERRLADLRRGTPEQAERQRRIETLNNDKARLDDAVSRLTDERDRLATLLGRLGGES